MGKMYGQLPTGSWVGIKVSPDGGLVLDDLEVASSDTPATLAYYTESLTRLTNIQESVNAPVTDPMYVRLSTGVAAVEMSVLLGALTETPPASDTASSGFNGRLQRLAQRITSLIALLPASLGQKAMAAAFPVVIASDQTAVPVSAAVASPVNVRLSTGAAAYDLNAVIGLTTETAPASDTAASGLNGRLQRIAQVLTSTQGALTETAPATDIASSGLNGRLQRIAQRLTSLIAQFPATIGQKTMANSLSVAIASDQILNVAAASNLTTSARTSVTAVATSTTLLAASATRRGASFFNDSTVDLYLAVGSTAASLTDYTVKIAPGGFYEMLASWAPFEVRGIWAASPTGSVRITAVS